MDQMSEDDLSALVDGWISHCQVNEATTAERRQAIDYYNGKCPDLPAEENRSSVVSRDVRDTVAKVLPSLMRVFMGGARIVDYEPVGPEDEAMADQASDVISWKFENEWSGYDVLWSALQDALQHRNGVIKWFYEQKIDVTAKSVSGLSEIEWVGLIAQEGVEVLETSTEPDPAGMPDESGLMEPQMVYSGRVRCKRMRSSPKIISVAPEDFLIDPDALSVGEAQFAGDRTRLRRSDLVAMGYPREVVDELQTSSAFQADDDKSARQDRTFFFQQNQTSDPSNEPVDYFECFVRVDFDNDGIAELRRVCLAGGSEGRKVLVNEDWDEIPYADIRTEIVAHRREGRSVFDDVGDIQRVKTMLFRQTLDNLYAQNMPQPIVDADSVEDPSAVTNPEFGKPIVIKPGADANRAVQYTKTPFVAGESFGMLEYLDRVVTDRTGVSDAASGLSPDALQNQTAAATRVFENSNTARVELMARTISESGLKRLFRGLLKLLAKHQDKAGTIRLRNQWVQFDPRMWNVDMDATVNTGLGAGSRERDMMMINQIGIAQEKLMAAFGKPGVNPFVTAENLFAALKRGVEAAGLRHVEQFFTEPSPDQIAALNKPQPTPEQMKIEGQMQVERLKIESQGQIETMKVQGAQQLEAVRMEVARDKEMAQAEADLMVKQKEMDRDAENAERDAILRQQKADLDAALERERIASNERIAQANNETKILIEQMRIASKPVEPAEPALLGNEVTA